LSPVPHVSRIAGALLPLTLAAALLATPTQAAPGGTAGGVADPRPGKPATPAGPRAHTWTIHSSDGAPGVTARPLPPAADQRRRMGRSWSYEVAPGLTFRRWFYSDARGPVRAQLLSYDLGQPGLGLDYLSAPLVPRRTTLTSLLARNGAVAGVNGDFFDIDDTGAPLGIGRDPEDGLRNAPSYGWTRAFWLEEDGTPQVGKLRLVAGIRQHPELRIQHLNSPTVSGGGIGIYRPGWGWTPGPRATGGQRRHVREVVISGGRVVANRPRLSSGRRIRTGLVLIGRGRGADALRRLRRGSRATLSWKLPAKAPVAIGGSVILLEDGTRKAINDVEMHPRTAVGIDRDGGRLLFLVVDGRQTTSRGLTMVELAELMRELGAEDALNLDGGGSSTMAATRPSGQVTVMNLPSDGYQRSVPNGLGITWTPPSGR
jgi:hypothetical protein